jgi:hypothetical protein
MFKVGIVVLGVLVGRATASETVAEKYAAAQHQLKRNALSKIGLARGKWLQAVRS